MDRQDGQEKVRNRTRLTSMVYVFLCLGFCLAAPIAAGDAQLAERLHEKALSQVGRVSAKESIKAFRGVLRADRDFASAHYEIARLYMALDTPLGRQSARKALDEAIRLELGNGDYQLMLGELLGKQGLWLKAERHYEKVLKTHPEKHAEAAYWVGFYSMQAFLKYIEMEHIDIITGGGPPTYHLFRWEEFGTRDREKALAFLTKSIESDPRNRAAFFDLGLIHFESKNPKGLVMASKVESTPKSRYLLIK